MLPRPVVAGRLAGAFDHRLTIVQAGAGYGKTTVLASLARSGSLCCWLSLEEPDADPQQFLRYLIAAFRHRLDMFPETPDVLLDEIVAQAPAPGVLPFGRVVDALANAVASTLAGPALLVLDDYHFVASSPVVAQLLGRFLAYLPSDLHVVISSRQAVDLPGLVTWRAHGEGSRARFR